MPGTRIIGSMILRPASRRFGGSLLDCARFPHRPSR